MRLAAALLVLSLPAFMACAPADAESGAGPKSTGRAFGGAADKASAEDEKSIAECISDNKNEGAKREVVLKYCTCMNDQMEDHETESISEWEKTHPASVRACDKVAGWK